MQQDLKPLPFSIFIILLLPVLVGIALMFA